MIGYTADWPPDPRWNEDDTVERPQGDTLPRLFDVFADALPEDTENETHLLVLGALDGDRMTPEAAEHTIALAKQLGIKILDDAEDWLSFCLEAGEIEPEPEPDYTDIH